MTPPGKILPPASHPDLIMREAFGDSSGENLVAKPQKSFLLGKPKATMGRKLSRRPAAADTEEEQQKLQAAAVKKAMLMEMLKGSVDARKAKWISLPDSKTKTPTKFSSGKLVASKNTNPASDKSGNKAAASNFNSGKQIKEETLDPGKEDIKKSSNAFRDLMLRTIKKKARAAEKIETSQSKLSSTGLELDPVQKISADPALAQKITESDMLVAEEIEKMKSKGEYG